MIYLTPWERTEDDLKFDTRTGLYVNVSSYIRREIKTQYVVTIARNGDNINNTDLWSYDNLLNKSTTMYYKTVGGAKVAADRELKKLGCHLIKNKKELDIFNKKYRILL